MTASEMVYWSQLLMFKVWMPSKWTKAASVMVCWLQNSCSRCKCPPNGQKSDSLKIAVAHVQGVNAHQMGESGIGDGLLTAFARCEWPSNEEQRHRVGAARTGVKGAYTRRRDIVGHLANGQIGCFSKKKFGSEKKSGAGTFFRKNYCQSTWPSG